MKKPSIKTATEIATMLHRRNLQPNKWMHITIYFGLRDTFRLYVNEPMNGIINIELARICGLYEQQFEKKIGTYSTLATDEKRRLVEMLEHAKFDMVGDDTEQFIYRIRNYPYIDVAPHITNIYNSRINEDDTRYIQGGR